MALLLPAVLADPNEYEGKRVTAIHFEPPGQPIETNELNKLLPLKVDQPLRLDVIRDSIKRLYATGHYANIAVATELAGAGAVVRFITTQRWFIGHVEVEGKVDEPPNRGQLVNAARLELGQPYTDPQLDRALDGIRQLLSRNGFYEAEVTPQLDYNQEAQQVNFRFRIKPGRRAHFRMPLIAGDPKMPPDRILGATKWKGWFRWKAATQSNVQRGLDGIRRKYEGQERLMAEVRLDSMQYDRSSRLVTPSLELNAGPQVEIHTEGAKIRKSRLRRYVPVYEERTVDRDLLVEGARNLRNYYQSEGYFDVDVDFDEQTAAAGHYDIDYSIDRGARHKLIKVEIDGNKYFTTDTIRERMFLQPARFPQFRHGRYSQGFLRRDMEAIKALYRGNGFRDTKVTPEVLDDYRGKPGRMLVILHIFEGPQYFVSKLEISGVRQFPLDQVQSRLASIEGQPFSEINVAADRDQILALYHTDGFPEAAFDWKFNPTGEAQKVALQYMVTEGREQFVREVLISGIQATRRRIVDPNVVVKPGGPLALADMTETQRRLYELGVFAKVDMAIQNPDGETDNKYVLYQIEEGHKYTVAVGGGAEAGRFGGNQRSLESPAGATGFSPRVSLDVSRLNFLGLGHSINFRSRVSTLQRRGLLNYSAPRYRNVEGRNLSFTGLYDDSRDVRTFSAKRLEGSAQLQQKWSKATTSFLRFSYRRVSVDQSTLKLSSPLLIPLLSQPARIGMLSGNLVQDRRNDPADTHSGIYNTLDLGLAEHFFASTKNFVRFLGRNATYTPIGKQLTLARSLQIGWLQPLLVRRGEIQSQAIPLPERFFAGGSTSMRGFPDNQAGPRDLVTGFPLGGNTLFFHQTELRFPLLGDNVNGVFFHDMGNVYSGPSKFSFRVRQRNLEDFDYMVHAAGFGIRYRTPVGPVRGDVAYSINSPRFIGCTGKGQQLFFGECNPAPQRVSRFQFFFSIGQTF